MTQAWETRRKRARDVSSAQLKTQEEPRVYIPKRTSSAAVPSCPVGRRVRCPLGGGLCDCAPPFSEGVKRPVEGAADNPDPDDVTPRSPPLRPAFRVESRYFLKVAAAQGSAAGESLGTVYGANDALWVPPSLSVLRRRFGNYFLDSGKRRTKWSSKKYAQLTTDCQTRYPFNPQ